jgi:hypothetical protein
VWIGDDPNVKTPHVTLMKETATPGQYAAATRRSGRVVDDQELIITYTPTPLQRSGPQTHVWAVEWQAVPWLGAPGLDTLDDRGGLPLGNYRFHVEGSTWTLDSQPFAVVAGGLELATATRTGGNIKANATWHAPKGWRLMDLQQTSNQPVPVRSQQVTVELLGSTGSPLSAGTMVNTDTTGGISVPDNASATAVRITDRFGNSATKNVN